MTGIADVYLFLRKPYSKDLWARMWKGLFCKRYSHTRFVVLSWKRAGSNLLCGMLYNHPEIVMHNELFNTIDIFTYYPSFLQHGMKDDEKWTVLARDIQPEQFLNHVWSAKYANGEKIRMDCNAIGFKSFPEHWRDSDNEDVWRHHVMDDPTVKKIILHREDHLSVYVSMIRAEKTGNYMTLSYPENLKVIVDPSKFQAFVNHYNYVFERKYKSATARRDTFWVTYEQLTDGKLFNEDILPLLWRFLGVSDNIKAKQLKETVRQSDEDENLAAVIENYDDLQFCFRHTDIAMPSPTHERFKDSPNGNSSPQYIRRRGSWSILLPICSREGLNRSNDGTGKFVSGSNRFAEVEETAKHGAESAVPEVEREAWKRLEDFAASYASTTTEKEKKKTEFVVGIDVDDRVFNNEEAQERIRKLLYSDATFVNIQPVMYGKICRIWNALGSRAKNDFVVLLGDDVQLLDHGWEEDVELRFMETAVRTKLPFGAASVALNDVTFPGFPTFPVIHRWHIRKFRRILPRQFVNQGGDPYLFELYSRWNASSFALESRMSNDVGGDNAARYKKYSINWTGQVLNTQLTALQSHLENRNPNGVCLDVVVPSYRTNNLGILKKIMCLRASVHIYVKIWIVVDNPNEAHLKEVQEMAKNLNEFQNDGNYFIRVLHYGENRGASVARNTGYNYSTADWCLFLDDDVIPDMHLLDAYVGAIRRYPEAKVMVGLTELPRPVNLWTEMLTASKVMFFYGVSKHRTHPPWGVSANMLVRGSRHNHTVQFKQCYPKSGGGEDIDLVFQLKDRYEGSRSVVSVPGAKVTHPWWNGGRVCYKQICGWAWGDSLCITEWPTKTFLAFPNWAEMILLLLLTFGLGRIRFPSLVMTACAIVAFDLLFKAPLFFRGSREVGFLRAVVVSIGAGTIISGQELWRVLALMWRFSVFSFCRRTDWFDGDAKTQVLDYQIRSLVQFLLHCLIAWVLVSL